MRDLCSVPAHVLYMKYTLMIPDVFRSEQTYVGLTPPPQDLNQNTSPELCRTRDNTVHHNTSRAVI